MTKLPKPMWLAWAILLAILFGAPLSSCHQGGPGQPEAPINPDTVKNHVIPIGDADSMTANFRGAIDNLDKKLPHFSDSMDFGHAEAFPRDVFRELLQQSDSISKAVAIRIYYGRSPDGKIRQILVPVDSAGNDIVNHMVDVETPPGKAHTEALKAGNGQAVQNGQRCPPICDSSSGLN